MASGPKPLHSRFDLASAPNAVRWGRKHATDVLDRWGVMEPAAGDALLIISELLSNAVQHAGKPPSPSDGRPDVVTCSLLLWLTARGLTVSVYDPDRCPPVLRSVPMDAERGRGLLLVQRLSEAWGYSYPSTTSGKLVWARLSLPQPPGSLGDQKSLGTSAPLLAAMSA